MCDTNKAATLTQEGSHKAPEHNKTAIPHSMANNFPNVAVIIINFNELEKTRSCIKALEKQSVQPYSIIVIDNNTTDDDLEFFESWKNLQYSDELYTHRHSLSGHVYVHKCPNEGYAAANNIALRLGMSAPEIDYFWILNNDTEPEPEALAALLEASAKDSTLGLIGSSLVYTNPPDTVQTLGGAHFSSLLGTTHFIGEGTSRDALNAVDKNKTTADIGYIVGASTLITKKCLQAIGPIPEEYFLYYEDVAWSLLAKRHGFGLGWAPQSIVLHHEGASTKTTSRRNKKVSLSRSHVIDYLVLRNRIWVVKQFTPRALPIVVLSYAGVILKRLLRKNFRNALIVPRAIMDGLLGRMGAPKIK